MRIGLLTNGVFPYVVGGMQKHTYYLSRYMARQGVTVDLFYALYPGAEADKGLEARLTSEEKANLNLVRVERPRTTYFPGHYIWNSYKTSQALLKAVKRSSGSLDFLYAQGFAGWSGLAEKKNGATLPPIGVNFHGLEMYQKCASVSRWAQQMMFRPFVRWNLRHADYVLSLGGALDDIVRSSVDPDADIIESPNGIEHEWLVEKPSESTRGSRTFVFVGRYARRKGIEELHETLRNFRHSTDWEFEFVGPIPENRRLEHQNVRYRGLIKEEEKMRSILRHGDVLVCPSYAEGMPTVILEAMASGLAIIASRVGAVDEMVSEENGWTIPPGDPDALRTAMENALSIGEKELMGRKKNSLERVEEFLWDTVTERTVANIQESLNRPE
ncbi:glycosyltransferase family 4 protein [Salinibacter ruber]|uniref:glycosyltransferase family 4 protein n=1 Tax=Salinibacter ruber TaxID=146919 RepID=UPI002073C268|nr:glycosyltransferase family 4 protein [Salinibacter ruber]